MNDAVVRLGVVQGEYHWHKHDDEDEFFFVLEGKAELTVGAVTVTARKVFLVLGTSDGGPHAGRPADHLPAGQLFDAAALKG